MSSIGGPGGAGRPFQVDQPDPDVSPPDDAGGAFGPGAGAGALTARPSSAGFHSNLLASSFASSSFDPRVSSTKNDAILRDLRSPDLGTRARAFEEVAKAYQADPGATYISLSGELSPQELYDALHTVFPEAMPGVEEMQRGLEAEAVRETNKGLDDKVAGATTGKDLDKVVAEGLKNPFARDDLMRRLSTDAPFRARVSKDGSTETKKQLAETILADPGRKVPLWHTVTDADKALALQALTDPKAPAGHKLTLDQVLEAAPEAAMNGLAKAMAGKTTPSMAELVGKGANPAHQLKAARAVLNDTAMNPDQRTDALRGLMKSMDAKHLDALLSGGNAGEKKAFAAVIAGSVPLQERVGSLSQKNQQMVIDQTLKLPLPRATVGRALWCMLHPHNMSAKDKNAVIDHLQNTRGMEALLETQAYLPFTESLLPGLSADNAAAVAAGFRELSKEAPNPEVANPQNIGRSVSTSDQQSYQKSKSQGTSQSVTVGTSDTHTDSSSSSNEYGLSFSEKGSIGIPFVAEGEVSSTQSYKHSSTSGESDAHGTSKSTADGTSTTDQSSYGYTHGYSQTTNLEAVERYNQSKDAWKTTTGYDRAARDSDDWASNQGDKYKKAYRAEKSEIH